ncbi:hypothetical protein UY3_15361 [Chelonia mydas]|uniref:Transmembrane protein TMEM132 cohesin-like domain-containing protein n=1 Tax=Chelonia mydas TaxID=8469 RepID=M7AWW3_CHEMY|nr:hypothetical protein UY3_15361 [Chelonia mydas]
MIHLPSSITVISLPFPSFHLSRSNSLFSEVVQMNFEIASFSSLSGTQPITWQVEYPRKGTTDIALSEIFICQKDLVGIVPLAMTHDHRQGYLSGLSLGIFTSNAAVPLGDAGWGRNTSQHRTALPEGELQGVLGFCLFPPTQPLARVQSVRPRAAGAKDKGMRSNRPALGLPPTELGAGLCFWRSRCPQLCKDLCRQHRCL